MSVHNWNLNRTAHFHNDSFSTPWFYIYIGAEDGVYTYTLSGGKLERLVSMPAGIRIHAAVDGDIDAILLIVVIGERVFTTIIKG